MEKLGRNIFRREAVESYISGRVKTEKIDIKKPRYAHLLWLGVAFFVAAALVSWNYAVGVRLTGVVKNIEAVGPGKNSRIMKVAIPAGHHPLVRDRKSVLLTFGGAESPVRCDYLSGDAAGRAGPAGGASADRPENAEISLSCPDLAGVSQNGFSGEFRMEVEEVKVVSLFF